MTDHSPENTSSRIVQLDGLRGIAVLFVVCFHYLNNAYSVCPVRSLNALEIGLKKLTYWGWAGVDLFFILSGFLIASILLNNRPSKKYFTTFYIRRLTRIVPIYYVLLIVFVAASALFEQRGSKIFAKPIDIGWYAGFLQNFQMSIKGYFGAYGLAPTWSLAVEEQFYLLIPLVIYFLDDKKVLLFCLLCILLAPVYRTHSNNWYQEYTHLFSRIDAPCYGVILALFSRNKHWVVYLKKYGLLLLVLLAGVLAAFVFWKFKSLNHSIISLLFLSLTWFALHLKPGDLIYRILTNPFLLKMGKYSYFFYLFHILVNGIMFLTLTEYLAPNLENVKGYLITILSFGATYLLASLSFRYFEGRLINWSHQFKYN